MQATHEIIVTSPESASRRQLLLAATFLNAPAALIACSSSDAVQTSAGGDGANSPLLALVRHATALGIRNAFLNQPVEASPIRPQFAQWLSLAGQQRPNLVVRSGHGPVMPMSLRCPVQAVIV